MQPASLVQFGPSGPRSSVHGAVDLGSQLFPLKSPFNMFKLLNVRFLGPRVSFYSSRFKMPDFGDTWGVLQYAESFQPIQTPMDPRIARSQHRSHLLPAVPGQVLLGHGKRRC